MKVLLELSLEQLAVVSESLKSLRGDIGFDPDTTSVNINRYKPIRSYNLVRDEELEIMITGVEKIITETLKC